jgi:GT2 family glycosyltransferase
MNCIQTLIESIDPLIFFEIVLVESSSNYDSGVFTYPDSVTIVRSSEKQFNFHRNLNLGYEHSIGQFIAFCNNDLVFHPKWFQHILKVAENMTIKAFSPVDPKEPKLPKEVRLNNKYVEGYEIQKYFKGWCFVVRREVFQIIGKFDERFNFYFADSDFIMTLFKYNLSHVAVMEAKVEHIQKKAANSYNKNMDELLKGLTIDRSKIPKYVFKENRYWLLTDDKMVEGLIQYHKKWGGAKALKIKAILAALSEKIKLPFLKRVIYWEN